MSFNFAALVCLVLSGQAPANGVELELPKNWHGVWAGQLTVHTVTGKSFGRPMELQVAPIKGSKSVTWKITSSFNDKKSVRNYELVPDPEKKGRFQIDEKNGILLDVRLMGDTLYTYFKDNDKLTSVKYERRGDSIFVEMASVILKEPRVTGIKSEMIEIHSYDLVSVQVGELKRQ